MSFTGLAGLWVLPFMCYQGKISAWAFRVLLVKILRAPGQILTEGLQSGRSTRTFMVLAVWAMRLCSPSPSLSQTLSLLGFYLSVTQKMTAEAESLFKPLTFHVAWLYHLRKVIYDIGFALFALLGNEAMPDRGYPSSLLLVWLELVDTKDGRDSNDAFQNIRRWRNRLEELADYQRGKN